MCPAIQTGRSDEICMDRSATVFVTGGSGFVGSAIVRKLVKIGFPVRTLLRRTSSRMNLKGLELEVVEGDLRDRESIRAALVGCRYVFHVAADYRFWAPDRREIFETNVTGTRVVMEEAMRAGVDRVVHTSSVATVGLRTRAGAADESIFASEQEWIGSYKQSKIAAERLVQAMVAEKALPAVIVNPATPLGPGDLRPTPTGRMIVAAASGRIPAFVDTGLNLVHVNDVALGHLAALEHGRIGERYILGGQNVPFAQLLEDIAKLVGRRAPKVRVPWYCALPVAYLAEGMARLTGREPLATVEGVRHSQHCMFFTSTKAERELNYRARSYLEGLREALHWFEATGYLPPCSAVRS